MEKKIFHTNYITGKQYTREEYQKKCRQDWEKYGIESIERPEGFIGKFKYNFFDVCLNPNRIELRINNRDFVLIDTCPTITKEWGYGTSLYGFCCGGFAATGSGCRDKAPTEREAIRLALINARAYAERSNDIHKASYIKVIEKELEKYDNKEILLFDL